MKFIVKAFNTLKEIRTEIRYMEQEGVIRKNQVEIFSIISAVSEIKDSTGSLESSEMN